jgi:hypothetical protein
MIYVDWRFICLVLEIERGIEDVVNPKPKPNPKARIHTFFFLVLKKNHPHWLSFIHNLDDI